MRTRHVLMLSLVLLACNSEAAPQTTRQSCQEVREHLVDLRLGSLANGGDRQDVDAKEIAKHRDNLSVGGGDAYLSKCVAERTPDWIACVLASQSRQEASACDSKTSG